MDLIVVKNYVKDFMGHSGHSFDHVLRVYNLCQKIANNYSEIDKKVLYTSALLHDIARHNEFQTGECHAKVGAEWAGNYLKSIGADDCVIEKVSYCISSHRHSKGVIPSTLEARILQEADRIDAIGAIGILRTLLHNKRMLAYHPTDPLARHREIDDFTYGIDHFYFKLLKLRDEIDIPSLKIDATRRHDFMEKFLNLLEKEVINNYEGDAKFFIHFVRDNYGMELYNIDNPFGKNQETIISKLIDYNNKPFINDFLNELKEEL